MSTPTTMQTESRCVVCTNNLVITKTSVPNRPPEFMIMGPGGEDNYREEVTIYCEQCGLQYFKDPQKSAPPTIDDIGDSVLVPSMPRKRRVKR